MPKHTFAVGDVVRVTKNISHHEFPIGSHIRLTNEYFADFAAVAEGHSEMWYVWPTEIEPILDDAEVYGDAASRPVVHFDDELAGRDRSKARAAASEAVSRVLKPEHNEILAKATNGESVDAYALNEAITAAIRSAATRHGQSTARREQAKRFAHVAHIVQAVLENHADNLPAYAEGERSRLLESERERTTALIREKTALEVENEDLKLRVGAAAERDREIEVLLRVLDYTRAECCADEAARQRSFGFEDGLRLH